MMENTNYKVRNLLAKYSINNGDWDTHVALAEDVTKLVEDRAEEARREAAKEVTYYRELAIDYQKQWEETAEKLAATQHTAGGDAVARAAALEEAAKICDNWRYQSSNYAGGCADEIRALAKRPPAASAAVPGAYVVAALPDAVVRRIFLAHGFTVKTGQADLKPYVFEAAHALMDEMIAQAQRRNAQPVAGAAAQACPNPSACDASGCCNPDGRAEAAAQADDVPFGIYFERNDGTSEFQRTGKAFQPSASGGLAWTLYTRAAPTAAQADAVENEVRERLARVFDADPHESLRGSQIAGRIRAGKTDAAQADDSALFNGFDIAKLPPILISCVAKLWPGSNGLFWDLALEKMPERIEQIMQERAAPTAQPQAAQADDVPKYETMTDHNGKVTGVRWLNADRMPPYAAAPTAQPTLQAAVQNEANSPQSRMDAQSKPVLAAQPTLPDDERAEGLQIAITALQNAQQFLGNNRQDCFSYDQSTWDHYQKGIDAIRAALRQPGAKD